MSIKAGNVLKVLLATYALTAVMLLVLSMCLYKLRFTNMQVNIGIMVVYAISTLAGGYILAKKQQKQRLIWGLVLGILYFVILSAVSFIINKGFFVDGGAAVKAALICVAAGAVGGILSPAIME